MADLANWYHWLEAKRGRWLHLEGVGPGYTIDGAGDRLRWDSFRIVGMEGKERVRVGLKPYKLEAARQLIRNLHQAHKIPHVRPVRVA